MCVVQVVALCLAAVAGAIDLRRHRIPNWLTVGAACAALAYHAGRGGGEGVTVAALGWLLGAAVFFLPFALGGLGAGDVKLVGALGAWLGPGDALWLALFSGVAGGVLALGYSLARGYLREALVNVWRLLTHWRVAGVHPLPDMTLQHGRGPRLAYGLAILAGTAATVWMR
jgi:prepilin peptidase CpaA